MELYEFLRIKVLMEIYHWTTKSYERHVAAGMFYEQIESKIDTFIETVQAKKRIVIKNKNIPVKRLTDKQAKQELLRFRNMLAKLKLKTGLANLRDEMITITDQTLYLFSLK